MYLLKDGGKTRRRALRVQLLGSGTILREVIAAAELLDERLRRRRRHLERPSFNELRRDGFAAERWNLLHPDRAARARATSSSCSKATRAR